MVDVPKLSMRLINTVTELCDFCMSVIGVGDLLQQEGPIAADNSYTPH